MWGSGTPERTKTKLRSLGLPVYEIEIRNVAGLADTLRGIGRLAGTEGVAQARAQAITADWAALKASYAGRRPVRVFYQLWDAPLMTLNGQHLISSAIAACGGTNVFGELPDADRHRQLGGGRAARPRAGGDGGQRRAKRPAGTLERLSSGERHEARRVRPRRRRPDRPQRAALRRWRARAVRRDRPRPPGPAASRQRQAASATH